MELELMQPYPSRIRGALSSEEKQRCRELNLCHYCASPNPRTTASKHVPWLRRALSSLNWSRSSTQFDKGPAQE